MCYNQDKLYRVLAAKEFPDGAPYLISINQLNTKEKKKYV
jgi:hypothetical protein